jgi:hypothetical protein
MMTDELASESNLTDDTLTVAPPGFRERVLAAQKAKTTEIRQSVEIPNPLLKRSEEVRSVPSSAPATTPATPDSQA